MIFLGVLLFVVAEIVSFVAVAEHIGFFWALAILLVVSALGPFVVRRVGTGVLAQTQQRLARGEVPTREVLDGLVVLIGGAMICIPGFISDAFGLLLMVGPLRRLVIRAGGRWLARRIPTIRIRSWRPPDVRSQPGGDDPPPTLGPPGRSLGPGDDAGPR